MNAIASWSSPQTVTYNDDGAVKADSNIKKQQKVYRKQLHVVGLYEEITPKGDGGKTNTTIDIIQRHDTIGFMPSASSWNKNSKKDALSVRYKGAIINDGKLSSDKAYVAEQSIPTTEFLRTTAAVPKYLADIDYRKTTASRIYAVLGYQGLNTKSTQTDVYGNVITYYNGKFLTENNPVSRSNYYYSMEGANVWIPDNTTVVNKSLYGKEAKTEAVTMFAKEGTIPKPSIVRGKAGSYTCPEYTPEQRTICYGVEEVEGNDPAAAINAWNSDTDSRKADAEGIVEPITAANEEITFKNGEGDEQIIMYNTGQTLLVEDPRIVEERQILYQKPLIVRMIINYHWEVQGFCSA